MGPISRAQKHGMWGNLSSRYLLLHDTSLQDSLLAESYYMYYHIGRGQCQDILFQSQISLIIYPLQQILAHPPKLVVEVEIERHLMA